VQAAKSTATGAVVTRAGAAATLNVEELDEVATHLPSALLAVSVKIRSAPSHANVDGSAGIRAMLLVGEHPSETVNPAFQVSYAV